MYSQAFEQSMKVGDHDNSFSRGNRDLKILAEASGIIEPAQGALNNPAPGKFFPLVRFDLPGNINTRFENLPDILHKRTAAAGVSTKLFDCRILLTRLLRGPDTGCRIMFICGVNHSRRHISHGIYIDGENRL